MNGANEKINQQRIVYTYVANNTMKKEERRKKNKRRLSTLYAYCNLLGHTYTRFLAFTHRNRNRKVIRFFFLRDRIAVTMLFLLFFPFRDCIQTINETTNSSRIK